MTDLNDLLKEGRAPADPSEGAEVVTEPPKPLHDAPRLDTMIADAISRIERRADGSERAIPTPWPLMNEQLGGGFWPGMHVLVSGTGAGKSTWCLQAALHAARHKTPTLYIGLELDRFQLVTRLLGDAAEPWVAWSKLYEGKASAEEIERTKCAVDRLQGLPLHLTFGDPTGWAADELNRLCAELRAEYPDAGPILIVLDFLQLVGGDKGEPVRERIQRAAYAARSAAREYNAAILILSSAARDKYRLLSGDPSSAQPIGLGHDTEDTPARRFIANANELVGVGKESGEIEFAADSVTAAIRVKAEGDEPRRVIFATAKRRSGAPSWSVLRFNGHRFSEPADQEADAEAALEALRPPKRSKGWKARDKEVEPDANGDAEWESGL